MFKSMFKKMIGKDPLSKIYEEFNKLKKLAAKNQKMIELYKDAEGTEELIIQRDILKNNISSLGTLLISIDEPKLKVKSGVTTYFNMQGTPTNVLISANTTTNYVHKPTDTDVEALIYQEVGDIKSDILKLERNFQENLSTKLKHSVRIKLEGIAKRKLNNKIIDFCNKFIGNEQLVRDFIFRNMVEPDEDYHNIYHVLDRLNFVSYLLGTTNARILNHEDFDITNKEIVEIEINQSQHKLERMNISDFLTKFNQKRFDFILINKAKRGGIIND